VHITDLTLSRCDLTGGEHGARDVAEALRRNTNIVTLALFRNGSFLDTVLEGLISNICLKNLVIRHSPLTEARGNALHVFFWASSTVSIQRIELGQMHFTERLFRPIAQGLINGSSVMDITFHECSFVRSRSIHLLNEILKRKQNLRALAMKECSFD